MYTSGGKLTTHRGLANLPVAMKLFSSLVPPLVQTILQRCMSSGKRATHRRLAIRPVDVQFLSLSVPSLFQSIAQLYLFCRKRTAHPEGWQTFPLTSSYSLSWFRHYSKVWSRGTCLVERVPHGEGWQTFPPI